MPIPIVTISSEAPNLYSPFNGKVVADEDGVHEDPTLLFSYFGDAGAWDHVSPRIEKKIGDVENLDEVSPEALCKKLNVPGAFCLAIDTGWNGVNFFAFAPAEEAA